MRGPGSGAAPRAAAAPRGGDRRVVVVPCSGIGKVQGLLSREATYLAVDELAREIADTLCLGLIVREDPEALAEVRERPCIAVDGCGKACARKNLEAAGGDLRTSVQVAGVLSKHRGAQPGTGSDLTEEGWAVAREIAEGLALEAGRLYSSEETSR